MIVIKSHFVPTSNSFSLTLKCLICIKSYCSKCKYASLQTKTLSDHAATYFSFRNISYFSFENGKELKNSENAAISFILSITFIIMLYSLKLPVLRLNRHYTFLSANNRWQICSKRPNPLKLALAFCNSNLGDQIIFFTISKVEISSSDRDFKPIFG